MNQFDLIMKRIPLETYVCILTKQNIVQINGDVGVAIWALVLVPKSGGVHQLVHDDSACDTSVVETHFLNALVQQPNVAPATSFPRSNSYFWSIWKEPFLVFEIILPSSTLVDLDVIGFGRSRNEADASFGVVGVHSGSYDISLFGCFSLREKFKKK